MDVTGEVAQKGLKIQEFIMEFGRTKELVEIASINPKEERAIISFFRPPSP